MRQGYQKVLLAFYIYLKFDANIHFSACFMKYYRLYHALFSIQTLTLNVLLDLFSV